MSSTTRITVYLRSPVPEGTEQRQSYILGRADSLRQQGLVDGLTVSYWHRLSTGATPRESAEIDTLERWAADNGCTLAPAFDRRAGRGDAVTLPLACVAYWEDDELVAVYPHAGTCGHCTVVDGLDRIEAALRSDEPLARP